MNKFLKIIGMAVIYAFIMSIGMVIVFIPASHLFAMFFKSFPPPSVLVGMAVIYAFIMSIGMVIVFIPASHLFAMFFKSFPPPSVLDWLKTGISVFLPINFIVNMLWIEQ